MQPWDELVAAPISRFRNAAALGRRPQRELCDCGEEQQASINRFRNHFEGDRRPPIESVHMCVDAGAPTGRNTPWHFQAT